MGAAAIASAVPQVVGLGMNIAQLVGAKKRQEAGKLKFEEGVEEVKNLMQKNVAEQLNVSDEATKLKYRQNLAAVQQLSNDMGGRGQRTALAGIPGLFNRQEAAAEEERQRLQGRLEDRQKIIVGQEEALRLEEKDFSEEMAGIGFAQEQQGRQDFNKTLGQTITGAGALAGGIIQSAPLYGKNMATRRGERFVDSLSDDQLGGLSRDQALDAIMGQRYDRQTINNARRGNFLPDEFLFRDYRNNLLSRDKQVQGLGVPGYGSVLSPEHMAGLPGIAPSNTQNASSNAFLNSLGINY